MLVKTAATNGYQTLYALVIPYSGQFDQDQNLIVDTAKLVRVYQGGTQDIKTWTITDTMPGKMVSFGAYIVVPGLNVWYNTADGTDGVITDMPDLDFIVECNNRLWGCKYGEVDGEMVNEIYASKLGDFETWDDYDGTSMASYAASVGSEGPWTGAIVYQGKPHFFKENHIHKVYISATGAHQIVDSPILGVADSAYSADRGDSLCEFKGVLYYMSREGVCAYDGSSPVIISTALGDAMKSCYYAAMAGAKNKLYLHFRNTVDEKETLYVYDTKRGVWHIEDGIGTPKGSHAMATFAAMGSSLFICRKYTKATTAAPNPQWSVIDLFGYAGTAETSVSYSCTSGMIGWQTIEQKYVSRFDMRLTLPASATMKVEIEYDSSGTWEEQGTVSGGTSGGTGSIMIPVRPRRCDHFRIRLSGTGEMRMFSWSKRLLKGSDVVK